jgi:hypothetical protein
MSPNQSSFSKQEMAFLQDQQFLLAKIEIGKKIEQILGSVEQQLQPIIKKHRWPEGVLAKSGKISKGELYRGLPYYVLDYPRNFGKEGVFAFRTMFWWGNFFSVTWHLSGKYLDDVRPELTRNLDAIRSSDVFICINSHPWDYHYGPENYLKTTEISSQQLLLIMEQNQFVKFSYHWSLDQYENLPKLVPESFKRMCCWFAE